MSFPEAGSASDFLALNRIIQDSIEKSSNSGGAGSVTRKSPANIVRVPSEETETKIREDVREEDDYKKKKKDPKSIWEEDEIPDDADILEDDAHDTRKRPEFDILYKQNVTSQDKFLGMSGKNASSSSCDYIVVRINFPGAKAKELDLDVTRTKLVAQSNAFKLTLSLPHDVKDKEGNAKWDQAKCALSVTLPIDRSDHGPF
eukprot:g361.t1